MKKWRNSTYLWKTRTHWVWYCAKQG